MLTSGFYYTVLIAMAVIAPVVFIALHFVTAGYGVMYTKKWGPAIDNKAGWFLMEAPAFFTLLLMWILGDAHAGIGASVIASLFLVHYFQRSFIFPFLLKGKGRMPLSVILMGLVFNVINAYLIGGWLFFLAPEGRYGVNWLWSPQFIAGTLMFLAGMWINLQSDSIVRHLRKPGDTRHYIPKGGMYRYVTSANYFGEFMEWCGFALLSWCWAGVLFAVWTFANLAPRARSLHKRYINEFGEEYSALGRRYMIPFLY